MGLKLIHVSKRAPGGRPHRRSNAKFRCVHDCLVYINKCPHKRLTVKNTHYNLPDNAVTDISKRKSNKDPTQYTCNPWPCFGVCFYGCWKPVPFDCRNHQPMMTLSNVNIFRVTGPLYEEFTDHRWIPYTKASDAGLWCFLWSAPE